MGTIQRNMLVHAIGTLFASGLMGKAGGSFIPKTQADPRSGAYKHGNSKGNNKTPAKPKYRFVCRTWDGCGIFHNLSTGIEESFKIAKTAGADSIAARPLTQATKLYFGI